SYDFCSLIKSGNHEPCAHASIVVGRRFSKKTGSCQFLVRNSHGPHCKLYEDMNVECDKDNPGHFWVDENALKKSMMDFYWIEREKKFHGEIEKQRLF